MTDLAIKAKISDMVAEYEYKKNSIDMEINSFEKAANDLKAAATIGGTWGQVDIDTGRGIYKPNMEDALLQSAWRHLFNELNMKTIMTAKDKNKFDSSMSDPAPFNMENIRATFGDYVLDPWGNILRGLAEVFCDLDQSYKSHEKVKIGVEGLPKRIIIRGFGDYSYWGWERLADVVNALASLHNKPLVSYFDLKNNIEDDSEYYMQDQYDDEGKLVSPYRGFHVKLFKNGNGHVHFAPDTLKDINRGLAEYYGEVLADAHGEKPTKRAETTDVSKDLQYYPTPRSVTKRIIEDIYIHEGELILEPSCGCGRFMDEIKAADINGVKTRGIEFDHLRAEEARMKGHKVLTANFLEVEPEPIYDRVIMNPPFYGKHYAKHVNHALKFLKEGGALTAILPVTARYDHGLLKGRWSDLPLSSFRESGTNINTTILSMVKESS